MTNLAAIIAAILYGTVVLVGLGIVVQLGQQSKRKDKPDTLDENQKNFP